MRKVLALILAMALAANMAAQTRHMVSLGVHGGASSLLEQTLSELSGQFGPLVGADLYYDYVHGEEPLLIGVRTGLGIALCRTSLGGPFSDQFDRTDYLGNSIHYTISGQVSAPSRGLQLAVPVMATLRSKGFYAALGAKAKYHSITRSDTRISDVHIDAYYPRYDVMLRDELITGRVDGDLLLKPASTFVWSGLDLALAAEMGYEWRLTIGRFKYWQMGVLAYMDCSLWNNYAPATSTNPRWLDVQSIDNPANPPAQVVFYDAYDGQISSIRPLEIGVKVTVSWVYEDMNRYLPKRRNQPSNLQYQPFKRIHK